MGNVIHTFRWSKSGSLEPIGTVTEKLTPLKAIKYACQECYGFGKNLIEDIKECPSNTCPLYPFRLGRSPKGKPLTAEQREKLRIRLNEARKHNKKGRKPKDTSNPTLN